MQTKRLSVNSGSSSSWEREEESTNYPHQVLGDWSVEVNAEETTEHSEMRTKNVGVRQLLWQPWLASLVKNTDGSTMKTTKKTSKTDKKGGEEAKTDMKRARKWVFRKVRRAAAQARSAYTGSWSCKDE